MAEEIGIVMSLYDKVTPTLKSITGNSKAFDKSLEELAASLKIYEQAQDSLVNRSSALKTALAVTNEKVKAVKASFRKLKDETSEGAMAEAIAEQGKLKQELTLTEAAIKDNNAAYKELYKTANNAAVAISKADNRAGGSEAKGIAGLGKNLAASGVLKMLSGSASEFASYYLGSAIGEPGARMVSGVAGGALEGAAAGMIAGPTGAAIGALVGGLSGLIAGGTEIRQAQDDAFKGYVQEAVQGQLTERSGDIQTGSAIAAQREQDAIAFNQLLGDGVGDQYLEDLRKLAAATPMEYSDLTSMSRALATGFGGDPSRMLDLMGSIGDAGSAVGIDAAGMTEMAQAMSRMESSNKASLEYLQIFQDRGVNVIGMLSEGLGKSQNQIYDMISKGKIQGVEAVDIIQAAMDRLYYKAMDKQSKTFGGRSSTLADAEAEMQAAYGEGYNEERGEGIQAQTDWLTGVSGEAQQEANKAIGAWQASLENSKEEYTRNAVDKAMETTDYQSAKAAGDAEEMGRILMEAKIQGMNEYNASEGAQLALESEMTLIKTVRHNTSLNDDYFDAGYELGQEYSKGIEAGMLDERVEIAAATKSITSTSPDAIRRGQGGNYPGAAYGLDRVPYDNFPALLHEGERVLTASEARAQDGGGGAAQVVITGNEFTVRTDADIPAVAAALADEIYLRRLGGQM